MAIELASKYAQKVQERFTVASKTDKYCGHEYDFIDVNTIKIYSVDTVPMTDYTRSGTSRYGNLTELGDTTQTMVLTRDRGFTFSIDKGNASEQFNIKQANKCLKRQIDEVITPEIDKYRFEKWAAGNGLPSGKEVLSSKDGVLTKANIVEKIFTANATMSDKKVPATGRVLFIPELTFLKFKLADIVMGGSDTLTAENIRRGYRGTIDGVDVVTVPSSIFPTTANFILKYKGSTVDVVKLKSYHVQKQPMGVDGDVVEGRIIYDSFVLDTKAEGIFVSLVATT